MHIYINMDAKRMHTYMNMNMYPWLYVDEVMVSGAIPKITGMKKVSSQRGE